MLQPVDEPVVEEDEEYDDDTNDEATTTTTEAIPSGHVNVPQNKPLPTPVKTLSRGLGALGD